MRKIIAGALCLLLAGLFGCSAAEQEEAVPAIAYGVDMITIDAAKVVISDEITDQEFWELLEYADAFRRPIANSYVINKQESYLDTYFRVMYAELPKFTNELKGAGAEKIKAYYAAEYKRLRNKKVDGAFSDQDGEPLIDGAGERLQYNYNVYSVEYLEHYVVINFFNDWYGGGAHGLEGKLADVFDLRTGEKLELGDLVDIDASAEIINQAVTDYVWKEIENELESWLGEEYDIRSYDGEHPTKYTMAEEGVILIFNPYEVAWYAAGIIEVPIPWETLVRR